MTRRRDRVPFPLPPRCDLVGSDTWCLARRFVYTMHSGERLIVPMGFVTDFASIPGMLRGVLSPTGPYAAAAVVHDYLYRVPNGRSRVLCDAIFAQAMVDAGVPWWIRAVVYGSVRVGGWLAWRRHRCAA